MGLIKITILVWVTYYIYAYLLKAYLRNHPLEALKYSRDQYTPAYKLLAALLNLARFVLLILSVVWLLFFR